MTVTSRSWTPLALWASTSGALIWWLSTYERGWVLAALYVGLNGLTLLVEWMHRDLRPARTMEVLAWAAAAQLPIMLWLYFAPDRSSDSSREITPPRHDDS